MAKSFDELVKRTTTKKTRAQAAVRAQEMLQALLLSEIRQLAGKSQKDVARVLGIKQPSLSKLEKQSDMQISTLQKIVKALGGQLAEELDRGTLQLAMRLVPVDWWRARLGTPAPANLRVPTAGT